MLRSGNSNGKKGSGGQQQQRSAKTAAAVNSAPMSSSLLTPTASRSANPTLVNGVFTPQQPKAITPSSQVQSNFYKLLLGSQ